MPKKKKEKDFIWYGLRVSFAILVFIWLFILNTSGFIEIIWIASAIFTFIVSILHLKKYESKVFPVIALVVSSIFLITYIFGVIIGLAGVL